VRSRPSAAAYRLALRTFARLPTGVRRRLVRWGTPSYSVGCLGAFVDGDRVLLVRQPHVPGWSLPGGLLRRSEEPGTGLVRELVEELGVGPGGPLGPADAVQVDPVALRIDLLWLLDGSGLDPAALSGHSAEIDEVAWRPWTEPEAHPITAGALRLLRPAADRRR
jgi:8-oxo-dGTP diphosphatase